MARNSFSFKQQFCSIQSHDTWMSARVRSARSFNVRNLVNNCSERMSTSTLIKAADFPASLLFCSIFSRATFSNKSYVSPESFSKQICTLHRNRPRPNIDVNWMRMPSWILTFFYVRWSNYRRQCWYTNRLFNWLPLSTTFKQKTHSTTRFGCAIEARRRRCLSGWWRMVVCSEVRDFHFSNFRATPL